MGFFAEELLNNFAQQIGAWRFCLYFLSSTRNDYVMMYSLTVFEVRAELLPAQCILCLVQFYLAIDFLGGNVCLQWQPW